MELVHFDADLLLNERQITCTRDSIMKMKKRLHDTQLTLILEPPENEPSEMEDWKAKVHELINRREKLDFPSMRMILKEKKDEAAVTAPIATVSDERAGASPNRHRQSVTQEQIWERMKRVELRKRLGTESTSFGAKPAEEVLRTIDNYQGMNSTHPMSRTLVRKHHIPGPFDNTSCVSSLIGPGQYDKPETSSSSQHVKDIGFQIAFKAIPRDKVVTADVIRDTAMQRSLSSPYRDVRADSPNYYRRQSDRNIPQSMVNSMRSLDIGSRGSRFCDSRGSDCFFSTSNSGFMNDPDEHAIRSLERSAKIGKGHQSDPKNSAGFNSSIKLNSLVESFAKANCFRQFEVKDYTLGALSSLHGRAENINDDDEDFVPEKNLLENNFRAERRQSSRSGGGKRSTSDGISLGRSSQAATIAPLLPSSPLRPQNNNNNGNLPVPPGGPQQIKMKRTSLWPEERQYSFMKNNKKLAINSRTKLVLKSTQSRGPLFSRECSRVVKKVYSPMKKALSSDIPTPIFTSTRSALRSDSAYSEDSADDFNVISDRIQSPSQVQFPPLEGDLRPVLDKWYIENNLYSPLKPKSTVRERLPEFIPNPCSSPLANSIALAAYKEDRKAATFSPVKTHRKVLNNSLGSLSSSAVDMNGIFLPSESIDSAVSSQLFASNDEFHLFIKENQIENDSLFQ